MDGRKIVDHSADHNYALINRPPQTPDTKPYHGLNATPLKHTQLPLVKPYQ